MQSAHFKQAQQSVPPHLDKTPKIVPVRVDRDEWSDLGEQRSPTGTDPPDEGPALVGRVVVSADLIVTALIQLN